MRIQIALPGCNTHPPKETHFTPARSTFIPIRSSRWFFGVGSLLNSLFSLSLPLGGCVLLPKSFNCCLEWMHYWVPIPHPPLSCPNMIHSSLMFCHGKLLVVNRFAAALVPSGGPWRYNQTKTRPLAIIFVLRHLAMRHQ